jgi:serine/threonine protein kinase
MASAAAPCTVKFQSGYVHANGSAITHGVIDLGMTGLILKLSETRVLKIPKVLGQLQPDGAMSKLLHYTNDDNLTIFENERTIYDRLGQHDGIIHCFRASDFELELVYAKDGNLEKYIESQKEPSVSTKLRWILSVISTTSYIHSKRILIDEIALRNVLVFDNDLKFTDFGQSILLPMSADPATLNDGNGLNIKIEILHLGWLFYAIAAWKNERYYYFDSDVPAWPAPEQLPMTEHLLCGNIIAKCWAGKYESVDELHKDASTIPVKEQFT